MTQPYSEADGRLALRDHVLEKAAAARSRYAGKLDGDGLRRLLEDRAVVRYPVKLAFDSSPLKQGEFGFLQQLGEHPADGFCLFLHPDVQSEADLLPLAVAYYIPSVNYGEIVSFEEAELFGAGLAGMPREYYYDTLCSLSDALWGRSPS